MYTSGALILTDDGEFVYKITHPKHEVKKTYTVTLVRRNYKRRNKKTRKWNRNRGLYKQSCYCENTKNR